MSSIPDQNFSSIDVDPKEISLSKETDFKTKIETLDVWISLNIDPNDMKFLSHIYSYMIYKILELQIQKMLRQRRYDQKTRSGTKSSKVHNSHKTYPFLLKI
jgi:hypothetical protein